MTIGELIRSERIKFGLTQRQLAALFGVSHRRVIEWESGRRPPGERSLLRFAHTFGLDLVMVAETAGRVRGSCDCVRCSATGVAGDVTTELAGSTVDEVSNPSLIVAI